MCAAVRDFACSPFRLFACFRLGSESSGEWRDTLAVAWMLPPLAAASPATAANEKVASGSELPDLPAFSVPRAGKWARVGSACVGQLFLLAAFPRGAVTRRRDLGAMASVMGCPDAAKVKTVQCEWVDGEIQRRENAKCEMRNGKWEMDVTGRQTMDNGLWARERDAEAASCVVRVVRVVTCLLPLPAQHRGRAPGSDSGARVRPLGLWALQGGSSGSFGPPHATASPNSQVTGATSHANCAAPKSKQQQPSRVPALCSAVLLFRGWVWAYSGTHFRFNWDRPAFYSGFALL